MAIFEIQADFGTGQVETRRVHAGSWIEAWQNANVGAGEDDTARITVRSTADLVDVEIAMSGAVYRVRSVPPEAEVTQSEAVTERIPIRSNRDRSGATTDPEVAASSSRRASDARPSADAVTERGVSARRATMQAVEAIRPASSGTDAQKRRSAPPPRTAAPTPDPRDLPQLFTPMAEFSSGLVQAAGRERGAVVEWAVDTVWQQVPARLVLALRVLGGEIRVTAARGEGAATWRGARASAAEWPGAIDLAREARMSFGSDPIGLWLRSTDDTRYPLEVGSVMWHPIRPAAGLERDGVRHVLMAVDAARPGGFTDGEMSALRYLCQMVAARMR